MTSPTGRHSSSIGRTSARGNAGIYRRHRIASSSPNISPIRVRNRESVKYWGPDNRTRFGARTPADSSPPALSPDPLRNQGRRESRRRLTGYADRDGLAPVRRGRICSRPESGAVPARGDIEAPHVPQRRSDRFRAVQERAVRGRGRDGGDRVPHHVLRGAARQHGLLDLDHRYRRQRHRAGPDPAHAPRVGQDRARRGARALRQRDARRRRLRPERPVRGRDAPAGHLHVQAGVRRRHARGVRVLYRAPGRHRRPCPRLERGGFHGDLPGRAADPADEAARRRCAQRDPVAADRAQRAHPRPGVRRSARPARGMRNRRAGDPRADRPLRPGARALDDARDARLHRAHDEGGARGTPGRRVRLRGLDRR